MKLVGYYRPGPGEATRIEALWQLRETSLGSRVVLRRHLTSTTSMDRQRDVQTLNVAPPL
jgi:hypothetical protein